MNASKSSPIFLIVIIVIIVGAALDRHVRGSMAARAGTTAESSRVAAIPQRPAATTRETVSMAPFKEDAAAEEVAVKGIAEESNQEIQTEQNVHLLAPDVESYEETPEQPKQGA